MNTYKADKVFCGHHPEVGSILQHLCTSRHHASRNPLTSLQRLTFANTTLIKRKFSLRVLVSPLRCLPDLIGFNGSKTNWQPLNHLLWKGSEDEASSTKATPSSLSPLWKVMLLSDGSVTRHLQLLTGLQVQVDCLEMTNIGTPLEGLPFDPKTLPGPLVQRQVFLRVPAGPAEPAGRALVYAASWWNAEEVDRYLQDKDKAIWSSLSQERTELYREIHQLYYGQPSSYLKSVFEVEGPLWGRHYIFWHGGRPLTVIYEVFSSSLEEYLGPPLLKPQPSDG